MNALWRRPSRSSAATDRENSRCRASPLPPECPGQRCTGGSLSKELLLEAFGFYEQERYDAGLAEAIAGIDGKQRLEAVLGFMVEFQHSYSLKRMVDVEPQHVLHQMNRVLPIMRGRLLPHFPGPDGSMIASIVLRIALSHALIPDDDPRRFLAELRHAAGLDVDDPVGPSQATPHRKQEQLDETEVTPNAVQIFLVFNSVFWLPWGLINFIWPRPGPVR